MPQINSGAIQAAMSATRSQTISAGMLCPAVDGRWRRSVTWPGGGTRDRVRWLVALAPQSGCAQSSVGRYLRGRLVAGQTGRYGAAGFDLLALTAEASLNQVVIGDFGCPEVAGMPAGQVCSRQAMLALATEHGLAGLTPGTLSDGIAAAAATAAANRAAAAALMAYGRRLGALIATLRDPGTPGAQARTPARRACLSHWLTVDSIWLAGGLLAGSCGPVILAGAHAGAAAAPAALPRGPDPLPSDRAPGGCRAARPGPRRRRGAGGCRPWPHQHQGCHRRAARHGLSVTRRSAKRAT